MPTDSPTAVSNRERRESNLLVAAAADKPPAQRMRERVFIIAKEFRLTRGQRLEVAAYVLDREVESFAHLGVADLSRLVDAFEGARYVAMLKIEQRSGQRC